MFYTLLAITAFTSQIPPSGTLISVQTLRATGYGPIDHIAVRLSKGDMIHSGIILDGYVYEAVMPRVKKTSWVEWKWLDKKPNHIVWILKPKSPYSLDQVARMKQYAESQVGRRYMVRGLWQHRETKGTFCSKYASEILEQSGRIKSQRHQETPETLWDKLVNSGEAVLTSK